MGQTEGVHIGLDGPSGIVLLGIDVGFRVGLTKERLSSTETLWTFHFANCSPFSK